MALPNVYKFRDLQNFVEDEGAMAKHKRDVAGKAKARYRYTPQNPNHSAGAPSPGGKRALTPGGPSGS